jgi:hypothetical protein
LTMLTKNERNAQFKLKSKCRQKNKLRVV